MYVRRYTYPLVVKVKETLNNALIKKSNQEVGFIVVCRVQPRQGFACLMADGKMISNPSISILTLTLDQILGRDYIN